MLLFPENVTKSDSQIEYTCTSMQKDIKFLYSLVSSIVSYVAVWFYFKLDYIRFSLFKADKT